MAQGRQDTVRFTVRSFSEPRGAVFSDSAIVGLGHVSVTRACDQFNQQ